MATKVEGELYKSIKGQLFEIGRQLRQKGGYKYDPKNLQKYIQDAIEGKFEKVLFIHDLPPWKIVKLGTFKSISQIREALKISGFKIGNWGCDILNKITLSQEETEVELVTTMVAELGFRNGACYGDIMSRIQELGLDLCPAEVGPQLRLQYPDQPKGEWIIIAMNPITDSNDDFRLFSLGHGYEGRWLNGHYGTPGHFWFAGLRMVFLRRKK
jgi:hypothetical protein